MEEKSRSIYQLLRSVTNSDIFNVRSVLIDLQQNGKTTKRNPPNGKEMSHVSYSLNGWMNFISYKFTVWHIVVHRSNYQAALMWFCELDFPDYDFTWLFCSWSKDDPPFSAPYRSFLKLLLSFPFPSTLISYRQSPMLLAHLIHAYQLSESAWLTLFLSFAHNSCT